MNSERNDMNQLWQARPPQLTKRDLAALGWLGDQRAATLPQLTRLLGHLGGGYISDRRGSQITSRWEELDLVERQTIWHREPMIIWPTSQGAKLIGKSRWRKPAIGTLRHTLAVSEVRLRSCRPGSGISWITEAALREIIAKDERLPDGAMRFADGSLTAVEVERTPHYPSVRVKDAIVSLASQRDGGGNRFAHVLYLCSSQTLAQVTAVRNELPEAIKNRVVVRPCPE